MISCCCHLEACDEYCFSTVLLYYTGKLFVLVPRHDTACTQILQWLSCLRVAQCDWIPTDMSDVILLISAWGLKPVMSHFGQDSVYRHCASSFVSLQSDTRRSVLPRQSTTTHCQAEPLSRHTSWVAALAAAAPTTGFEPATLTPALSEFIISIPHAQTPNGAIPDRMKDHCEVEPDDGYDGRGR